MSSPTTRSIAEAAGVSQMTVSLALRNSTQVSKATRDRIHKIAGTMGYCMNPLVSAWMGQRRRHARPQSGDLVFAYINCFTDPQYLYDRPTFQRFFNGALKRAREWSCTIDEFRLFEPKMNAHRLDSILRARGIRGVIVGPQQSSNGRLDLEWNHYAAVTQGYSLVSPRISRTGNDYVGSLQLCIHNLRCMGYKRIGLVIDESIDARARHVWSGTFAAYQQKAGCAAELPVLAWRTELRPLSNWLTRHEPDAIVTPQFELLESLRTLGVRIPEELGLAHLDWHPKYQGWAGVDQNIENAGASAVDLIVERLIHNDLGIPKVPKTVTTEGVWRSGGTVRQVGASVALPFEYYAQIPLPA